MKRIRPIRQADLPALLELARGAGAGFTSLPPVADVLAEKIARSEASFSATVERPGAERYLFVMEDLDTGALGACCAIEAACGLDEAFYSYRLGLAVHASRELGIYNPIPTLYLSSDLTGASVLCSLYMRPDFRGGGAGRLLSRCRFLFMANAPERFPERVIAELRGVSDAQGRSPFWEGLGRHFFSVDYERAEHIVGMGNKAFIAELMPPHPIYSVLLPESARAVIGKVHVQTEPALHLLAQEGFRAQGYVDIFDGGPTVEAARSDIRTIRESALHEVAIGESEGAREACLVANLRLQGFRCVNAAISLDGLRAWLPREVAEALGVRTGDSVRCIAAT